jgi:MFS family permease
LQYAAVMGLPKDLNLKGNDFTNVATFLFVALFCFSVPNGKWDLDRLKQSGLMQLVYFLQVVPAAKWLGANVVLWGVATASGAAAHNYHTLLVSRVFLGIFEASIAPSLILISSQWYTKSEQAPRFSFWYLGLGLGQIIGGAVSYGFQHVETGTSFAGWRTMFVTLGAVTVLFGLCTFFFLPDTPMKAHWLSGAEKVALLNHVSINRTGMRDTKFKIFEIFEAFLDPQLYLLFLAVVLVRLHSHRRSQC